MGVLLMVSAQGGDVKVLGLLLGGGGACLMLHLVPGCTAPGVRRVGSGAHVVEGRLDPLPGPGEVVGVIFVPDTPPDVSVVVDAETGETLETVTPEWSLARGWGPCEGVDEEGRFRIELPEVTRPQ